MLARGVSERLARAEPASIWGDTMPIISSGDLRLVNLECCISEMGEPFQPPRVFYFRAIPKAVEVLASGGIEVVTLANNHSLDYGPEALMDTIARLDEAGILHVGAGEDAGAARRPVVVDAAGRRVGFVGFTDNYPEYAAGPSQPGTFHVKMEADHSGVVLEAVQEARNLGADKVVVTAHVGPNMVTRPPEPFRKFTRAVIDGGADVWFGHSAHVFQGVEFRLGKPIVYDGGDFVDDYAVDPHLRNDLSLIWVIGFEEEEETTVVGHPIRLSVAETNMAVGADLGWIEARLRELCAEMGSDVLSGPSGSLEIRSR